MTDAGFFRGTSAEQDNRFSNKQKKLLKQLKFSDNLSVKIDINKVNIDVMKPWISRRITQILGMEDDVVVEFVYNQLEAQKFPDGKMMQINLTGFLNGKNAREFMGELWELLISAQNTHDGIPPALIELKKLEIKKKQQEEEEQKKFIQEQLLKNGPSKSVTETKVKSPERRRKSYSRSKTTEKRRKSYSRSPSPDRRRKYSKSPTTKAKRKSYSRSPKPERRRRYSKSPSPTRRRKSYSNSLM